MHRLLIALSLFVSGLAAATPARLSVSGAHAAIHAFIDENVRLPMKNPRFEVLTQPDRMNPDVRTFSARLKIRSHDSNVARYVGRVSMKTGADAPRGADRVIAFRMYGAQ